MDAETLRATRIAIQSNISFEDGGALVDDINIRLALTKPQPSKTPGELSYAWRAKMRQLVQEIVVPQEILWMEDDFMTVDAYVERALHEIQERFKR